MKRSDAAQKAAEVIAARGTPRFHRIGWVEMQATQMEYAKLALATRLGQQQEAFLEYSRREAMKRLEKPRGWRRFVRL